MGGARDREQAHTIAALKKDAAVVVLMFLGFFGVLHHQYADASALPAVGRAGWSAALAALMWGIIALNVVALPLSDPQNEDAPAAARLDAKWYVISGVAGHAMYFTQQTLMLHAVHYTACAVGELNGSAPLLAACNV